MPISDWPKKQIGPITLYIANTPELSSRGMQHLHDFPDTALMVFRASPNTSFHTLNCKFPLDLVALDKNLKVLSATQVNPGEAVATITPINTAYVIEAKAGFLVRNYDLLKNSFKL